MKKAAFILLLSLYTVFSVGLCLQLFYCGGKLKSVRVEIVSAEGKEKGCCCTDKGCCNTKHHLFKIEDSHIAADYVKAPAIPYTVIDIAMSAPFDELTIVHQEIDVVYNTGPPLLEHTPPLYILNCDYRI